MRYISFENIYKSGIIENQKTMKIESDKQMIQI